MVYSADSGVVVNSKGTCIAVRRDGLVGSRDQHITANDVKRWDIGAVVTYPVALRMTTTSNGCGGYSTGHHLHFFLNPSVDKNAPPPTWKSFDIQGWHLNCLSVNRSNLVKQGVA